MPQEALGLIEARSLHAAMEASAAATSAAIVIASVELIDAAFVIIKLEGELGAVQTAVDAGAHAAQRAGKLIAARIIPRTPDNNSPHPTARRRSTPAPHRKNNAAPVSKLTVSHTPAGVATPVVPVAAPSMAAPSLPTATAMAELEEMSVVKLRQYARTVPNLPIQGRQISAANKQQLLEAIRAVR